MKQERSKALMERARRVIPGGVNSPVRAYRSVGGEPPFIVKGHGCRIEDEDGNRYVDLVMSYGPLIFGHDHPAIREAVAAALVRGTTYGAPTRAEVEIAELICERVPSVEMVRLVNSGTEACMSALRLARAFTGRKKILKFNGCYHGHMDSFLVKAGSGASTLGAPDSPGVPQEIAGHTVCAEYNALDEVEAIFAREGDEMAAIFVEPVAGNMGCVLPAPGFLEGLRALCDRHGALLIFDEVMTGFRVAAGCYQEICGVMPDLSCLGKVIGGGLPVGAYGGRLDVMSQVSPAGDVYQAGTLSGNPLAVAGGMACLKALGDPAVYEQLERTGAAVQSGLERIGEDLGVPLRIQRQGSMVCLYFTSEEVRDFPSAAATDHARFRRFHRVMLECGVHLPPSPYEAWFLSTAHDEEAVDAILEAARTALGEAARA